jgi:hypothetical protein
MNLDMRALEITDLSLVALGRRGWGGRSAAGPGRDMAGPFCKGKRGSQDTGPRFSRVAVHPWPVGM